MEEDVELCLEVQVDPASKKILSNPERCRSTLLDVTVVKPKELEAFGTQKTNTLRADAVRKLLSTMEKQRRKKQKVLDKLKDDDTIIKIRKHDEYRDSHHRRKAFTKHRERISPKSPVDDLERKDFIGIAESIEPLFCEIRRSLKNVETRITNMQDINLSISQTTVDETASEELLYTKPTNLSGLAANSIRDHSVYRVETLPRDLKSVLLCSNKQRLLEQGDKIEGKCLCENCGVVGLLMECQKHPLLNELSESVPPSNHSHVTGRKKKPKKTSFASVQRQNLTNFENWRTKSYNESVYVNELTNRVKLLEERLAAQEEKVVPKDYFKKIITKMVHNFSPKLFKGKSDLSLHSEKSAKKTTNGNKTPQHQSQRSEKTCESSPRSKHAFTCCNTTVKYEKANSTTKSKAVIKPLKNDKATATDDELMNADNVWRWGGEVLKPGIDLKNRIVSLLNDIISKIALSERGSFETPRSKSLKPDKCDSEMFMRFMKRMNTSVYRAQVDSAPKFFGTDHDRKPVSHFEQLQAALLSEYSKKSGENSPEKQRSRHQSRRASARCSKNVDISYVNPKLSKWRTESPDACKTENVKDDTLGKHEFLKIVSKAKQYQKDVLWTNIWNQARANGQDKSDKITIKIPCSKKDGKGQRLYETEVSIGDVEEILKGA